MKYYPQDSFRPEPLVEGGGQTVAILCSSGTNGLPKPICLSNKSLLLSFGISSELVLYTSSSMDRLQVFCPLSQALCLVLPSSKVDPVNFVQLVRNYKVSVVFLPPEHLSAPKLWNPLGTCLMPEDLISCPPSS